MPQAFSLTVHHSREFLLVVAVGRPLLSDLVAAVDYVAAVSAVHGDRCALFDFLSMDADLTDAERSALEDRAALVLKHMKAIARVGPVPRGATAPAGDDREGPLPLRAFTNMKEATDWLASMRAGGVESNSAK